MKRKHLYETMDWSKDTKNIAEEINASPSDVSNARRKYSPETLQNNRIELPKNIDWNRPIKELSEELNITPKKLSEYKYRQSIKAKLATVKEKSLQTRTAEWAEKTFPDQPTTGKFNHLKKEILELGEDLTDGEEMADCLILLMNIAERAGVDLIQEGEKKLAINKTRTWGEMDDQGVIHHIEDSITKKTN